MKGNRKAAVLTAALLFASSTAGIAQEVLTGDFRLSRTTSEIAGPEMAQKLSKFIPVDESLKWQIYVPQNYQRDRPPGLFVYINPDGWGGIPDQWKPLFDAQNLIWIGANRGSGPPSETRDVYTALFGSRILGVDYSIDLDRVYVGSSGRAASTALNVLLRDSEITGAVYISGSAFWGDQMPDRAEILRRKYYVFITGSDDQAKTVVRRDYESYKSDGVQNVKLIFETGRLGKIPEAELIEEALQFLDSHLAR
jgi:hypothetical protein